jgi:hypothetical protein
MDLDLDPVQLFRIWILPGLKVDPSGSTPLLYDRYDTMLLIVPRFT